MRTTTSILFLLAALCLTGCATYTTPGGPADFSKLGLTPEQKATLTDRSVQKLLDKKPLVTFPASIAIARVQAPDYSNYYYSHRVYYHPYAADNSAYSVVTTPDESKPTPTSISSPSSPTSPALPRSAASCSPVRS